MESKGQTEKIKELRKNRKDLRKYVEIWQKVSSQSPLDIDELHSLEESLLLADQANENGTEDVIGLPHEEAIEVIEQDIRTLEA